MTKESDNFEKQITRIHEFLEGSNADVTWNEKIPDPDNPSQPRQIDFTIKNSESFTMGECRFRKGPEDVQWIEELIGRKISLQADGVIAVSSSGFTEGAIRKASAHGIILRNFFEITDKELESWGKKTNVKVIFAKLMDLIFRFPLNSQHQGPYKFTNEDGHEIQLLGFLQGIIHRVDDLKPKNNPTTFGLDFKTENLFVCGEKLQHLHISGCLEKYEEDVSVSSVLCYSGDKSNTSKETSTFVQKLDLAQSEIIGHQDSVSIIMDCSNMDLPQNTFFYGFATDFGRIVNIESLELVGIESAFKSNIQMKFDIEFYQ
jgi:hypothetical protein